MMKGTFFEAKASDQGGNLGVTLGSGVQGAGFNAYSVGETRIGAGGLYESQASGYSVGGIGHQTQNTVSYSGGGYNASHGDQQQFLGLSSSQTQQQHLGPNGFSSSADSNFSVGGQSIFSEQGGVTIDRHGIDVDYRLSIGGETVNCDSCSGSFGILDGMSRFAGSVVSFFGSASSCMSRDVVNSVMQAGHALEGAAGSVGHAFDGIDMGEVAHGAGEVFKVIGDIADSLGDMKI